MPKCPKHHIDLVSFCPACRGAAKSELKAAIARENGRKGGRPKGSKNKPKEKI